MGLNCEGTSDEQDLASLGIHSGCAECAKATREIPEQA